MYSCTSLEIETVSNSNGEKRGVEIYTSAFTFRELELMLTMSGLDVEVGYGARPAGSRRSR